MGANYGTARFGNFESSDAISHKVFASTATRAVHSIDGDIVFGFGIDYNNDGFLDNGEKVVPDFEGPINWQE